MVRLLLLIIQVQAIKIIRKTMGKLTTKAISRAINRAINNPRTMEFQMTKDTIRLLSMTKQLIIGSTIKIKGLLSDDYISVQFYCMSLDLLLKENKILDVDIFLFPCKK